MGSLWYSTGHAVGQSMVTEVCPGGKQLSPIAIPEGIVQAVYYADLRPIRHPFTAGISHICPYWYAAQLAPVGIGDLTVQ